MSDNSHKLAQEEIFGPVVVVEKFEDEEEAINIANDSEYGLAGGVFTTNLLRALNVAKAIQTGRIWVNTYNMFPAGAPFGGYKNLVLVVKFIKMQLKTINKLKISLLIQVMKQKAYTN